MTTRSGDFNGAFYVVLAFDFAEIEILVGGTGAPSMSTSSNLLIANSLALSPRDLNF